MIKRRYDDTATSNRKCQRIIKRNHMEVLVVLKITVTEMTNSLEGGLVGLNWQKKETVN